MVRTQILKPGDIYVNKSFCSTNIFLVEKYYYNTNGYRVRCISNSDNNANLGKRFHNFRFWENEKVLFPAKVGD